jgi:hypothetical protein
MSLDSLRQLRILFNHLAQCGLQSERRITKGILLCLVDYGAKVDVEKVGKLLKHVLTSIEQVDEISGIEWAFQLLRQLLSKLKEFLGEAMQFLQILKRYDCHLLLLTSHENL